MTGFNRRRVLTIAAATAVGGLGALSARNSRATAPYRWRGTAMGADARILLATGDRARAERVVRMSLAEVARLERIFSLYDRTSDLARLNATGSLRNPAPDMVDLLRRAERIWRRTDGAFDVTVQPLWRRLADHFAAAPDSPGPTPADLRPTLDLVGADKLAISPEAVRLAPGMAVTMNGIAQGYITDRVADILEAEGFRDVLIDLGELRALAGRSWPVAIAGAPGRIELNRRALATSAGHGAAFNRRGDWHHLIDPRHGFSANAYRSVSVVAASATLADGLSTALALTPPDALAGVLARFAGAEAYILDHAGGFNRV